MPKLICGLSKRIEDFEIGSRTASVSVEVELDAATIRDTAKLKQHIRCGFDRIREAIEEELARPDPMAAPPEVINRNGHSGCQTARIRRPR